MTLCSLRTGWSSKWKGALPSVLSQLQRDTSLSMVKHPSCSASTQLSYFSNKSHYLNPNSVEKETSQAITQVTEMLPPDL